MTKSIDIDIDALLQNTWLQIISLKHTPKFEEGEGKVLWDRCVADIERVQQVLQKNALDEQSCQNILMAQCALLDETVKSRDKYDDACIQWYKIPLQGHFFGTMEAGESLCDRMREVLHEPAPNTAVVTCFQRVMMLDFLGGFDSIHDPERQKLVDELNAHAEPFSPPQITGVIAKHRSGTSIGGFLSSWPMRIAFSALVLAVVWFGLSVWLDHTLVTQLPEVVK
ncbi:MAG: type VI secretion system protein TssL, short form [Vibrio sp.]